MNPFDDPELSRMLDRLAGTEPDTTAAYARVQGRVRQVRRRRAAFSGTAVIAVVIGLIVMTRPPSSTNVTIATDPGSTAVTTPGPTATEATSTTELPTTTGLPQPVAPDSSITPTDRNGTTPTAPAATQPSVPGTTRPPAQPSSVAPTPTVASPTTKAPSATTTTAAAPTNPPSTIATTSSATCTSIGGSVTVSQTGTTLTLQNIKAAAGFTAELDTQEASKIKVKFKSPTHESKVEVRPGGSGPNCSPSEESSRSDGSPTSTDHSEHS